MATTTIPTSFLHKDTNVCPSGYQDSSECGKNKSLATTYLGLMDTLSSQKNKTADMQTLYGRELSFTINMIVGCVALGLYIKWNN